MGIELVCRCDKCSKILEYNSQNPQGFAILGNIHNVNPKEENAIGGGFIGNNLEEGSLHGTVVKISYYCTDCLLKALYIDNLYEKKIPPLDEILL